MQHAESGGDEQEIQQPVSGVQGCGLLRIDAPDLAAEQLTWLVLAAPPNRLTLRASPCSAEQLKVIAREAVATFLSRFGQAPASAARTPAS